MTMSFYFCFILKNVDFAFLSAITIKICYNGLFVKGSENGSENESFRV